ncbi:MAG: response regulator, partial [Nitrospiraceae bacterium]|nr:response regulator [Nitrospiraceae bacterium]
MQSPLKKVLVVEDEIIFTLNLADLLEMWGYEVLKPVSSAAEAVRAAEDEGPDLIIMDINIKGRINGVEAAARIHERRKVPIIFISGYTYDDIKEKIDGLAPRAFFNKP